MIATDSYTDRYVAAAMRTVPEAQRADLAAELRASIRDQIDAHVEGGLTGDAAERAVLTELGDPDKLAAGYTDRRLSLLGPRYYLDWWRLLTLLLWIVLPCAAFAVGLGQVLAGAGFGEIIGAVVVVLLSTTVHLFFWVTLVFVIVERTGAVKAPLTVWTIDQLPQPKQRGVGFADMVASLVFLVIAAGAVVWDHLVGFAPGHPGLSFLSDALWPWWIALLFAVMAVEAALSIVVYLVGRWTPSLAILNMVLALAIAVPAIVLLLEGGLVNADFWPSIIPADSATAVEAVMLPITAILIGAIALWDIIDVLIKTIRGHR